MAQKLLDRTQIAPGGQKMRGKAVAQGMGSGRGGQAHLEAGLLHDLLHKARVQGAAARAAKRGASGVRSKGQRAA